MTPYEQFLYNQMIKLSRQANRRILNLERLTGKKEPFGVKSLYDYLSNKQIDIITKKGRIGTRKRSGEKLSIEEMRAVKKKIQSFLSKDTISTVRQAKAYKKELEKKIGKKIKWTYAMAEYQAKKSSIDIVDHVDSDFWVISRLARDEVWQEDRWVDEIKNYLDSSYIDEATKEELHDLYEYAMEVKG